MNPAHPEKPPSAFLLDIDGTLMVSSSAHLSVLATVLTDWTGRRVTIEMDGETPMLDGHAIAGWVDSQVIRQVLADGRAGAADPSDLRALIDAYGDAYRGYIHAGGFAGRAVAGAAAFLDRAVASGVRLALVTGNTCAVAHAKLDAVGLAGFFDFDPDLGFGDWRQDRDAVCEAALARLTADGLDPASCALVGDTVADMRAGTRHGLRIIGVRTGSASADALVAAGAALVVDSVATLMRSGQAGTEAAS